MIVDVHAHALSEDFIREAARDPARDIPYEILADGNYFIRGYGVMDRLMWDLEGRLESLARRGIDLQLVAPPPPVVANQHRVAGVELTRRLNRETAKLVGRGGGRLGGLVVVPLGEPQAAAEEIRRAVGDYGFRGAAMPTSAAGRPLDLPEYAEVWAVLEELGLLVFMHSTTGATRDVLADYTLNTVVGWPTETTICVSRLIFSGVLERHPQLALVLSHGGGTLPYLRGRLNLAYSAPHYEANPACRAHITKPPGDYFRQLYFDTVVASADSLRFLIELVGADRVMFGSDFPFEIGDAEGAASLPVINALAAGERDRILGGNAAAVLDRQSAGAGRRASEARKAL